MTFGWDQTGAGDLRFRLALEREAARTSSRLISTTRDRLGDVAQRALAELGSLLGVDHCFLLALDEQSRLGLLEEWRAPGVDVWLGMLEWMADDAFSWFADQLRDGPMVLRHDDDPGAQPHGVVERVVREGIDTMVLVGIVVDARTRGVFGLTTTDRPLVPPLDVLDLVRLVGESFVNRYERARVEDELGRITRDLEQRNADLTRANHDLDEFASIASHDLQSPLFAMLGFLELLDAKRGQLDEEGRSYLEAATRGAVRMRRLVDDLLTYSRAGWTAIDRQPVDLRALAAAVVSDVGFALSGGGLSASVDELPVVQGDETMLRQLFQNLVSNAARFGRSGVPVRVDIGAAREEGEWVVWVADNGIGIPAVERERVFQMFTRFAHAPGGGAGIGLAICQRVVAAHGGAIWVEDGVDGGTKICFTIPDA